MVVNSCFCDPPPASNRGRKRKRSSLNLLRLLMKWSHCRRTFTPGPSVYLKVLSLHGDHIQQWLVKISLTSHIPVVLTPFSSDNAAPAAPAAWLPACRRVPAPPQTQTPPDKAITALQSQYHPEGFFDYRGLLMKCNSLHLDDCFFFLSFYRNVNTIWLSRSLTQLQSSLKSIWWPCECDSKSAVFLFKIWCGFEPNDLGLINVQ